VTASFFAFGIRSPKPFGIEGVVEIEGG